MYSAHISISQQRLVIVSMTNDQVFSCAVNTAKNGVGNFKNSGCTPLGAHYVRAAIGNGLSAYAVLKGRRPTGELYSEALATRFPDRDWILGRILWLCGLETGVNRGGKVDTFQRYIYIHGSPESAMMETPASHGCIRLAPIDMLSVFNYLPYAARVSIQS